MFGWVEELSPLQRPIFRTFLLKETVKSKECLCHDLSSFENKNARSHYHASSLFNIFKSLERGRLLFYVHGFQVRKHNCVFPSYNNVYEKGISTLPSAAALNALLAACFLVICNHMFGGFSICITQEVKLINTFRAFKNRAYISFIH